MSKDVSTPAFPIQELNSDGTPSAFGLSPGLTKREYFAAMAMQGMLADSKFDGPANVIARLAFAMADAMIAEENKQ